jgi:CO/xanthine dehydrogenase Mo-binding subunit
MFHLTQATVGEAMSYAQNAYNATAWSIVPHAVVTDTAPNTFTRGPGTTQVKPVLCTKNYGLHNFVRQRLMFACFSSV